MESQPEKAMTEAQPKTFKPTLKAFLSFPVSWNMSIIVIDLLAHTRHPSFVYAIPLQQ